MTAAKYSLNMTLSTERNLHNAIFAVCDMIEAIYQFRNVFVAVYFNLVVIQFSRIYFSSIFFRKNGVSIDLQYVHRIKYDVYIIYSHFVNCL